MACEQHEWMQYAYLSDEDEMIIKESARSVFVLNISHHHKYQIRENQNEKDVNESSKATHNGSHLDDM